MVDLPVVVDAEDRGGSRVRITFDDNTEKTIDSGTIRG
jgi:hypothetical protein